jgi:hypothetical protein
MLTRTLTWWAASIIGGVVVVSSATACGGDDNSFTALPDAGVDGSGATGGDGTGGSGASGAAGGAAGAGAADAGGCESTTDCPTGQVCNRTNATCVECMIDGDCGIGTRCVNNQCEALPGCTNSLDCVGQGSRLVCDTVARECVQCMTAADCAENHDCLDRQCVAYTPCVNSLDCPSGQVCDDRINRCVECVTSTDCGTGNKCVGNICRPECESDNQCTPHGLLCSRNAGYCVECVRDEDCAEARYCGQSFGICAPDVCTPGAQRCENNVVQTCSSNGSGWASPLSCGALQTCKQSGSSASCQDWICTPSVVQCDTATGSEKIVQCSADGLAQALKQDCGLTGQVCFAAQCRDVVCNAGQRFCSNGQVRQCSAKGHESTLVTSCTTNQYCDDATAACRTRVCTPDAPACNGSVATTCNSLGSGYLTGGTDCTLSSLVCSQGECKSQVCTPSTNFCELGNVQRCAADGMSSTLWTTCTSSQYCDDETATCRARLCTPDAPACNGNVATTCNSLGSGYLAGGSDCGSLYCVSGTCQSALFVEDFEDGDFDGWTALNAFYTRSVTNTTAAAGTFSLVQMKSTNGSIHYDGLSRTFTSPVQPARISWWARAEQVNQHVAYFIPMATTSTGSDVVFVYFTASGQISVGGNTTVFATYVASRWYNIELRNINWTARTFDVYVDGVLLRASLGMRGTGTSISRLDLYNYSGVGTAYWDHIEFQ